MRRRLSTAERWLNDGILVAQQPAFLEVIEVDMTAAQTLITEAKRANRRITYLHMLVWASARALKAHPGLHRLLCGNSIFDPESADIGISVQGETVVAPVLTIERAEQKSIDEIAEEIAKRIPEANIADRQLQEALNRFGWLVPFAALRRAIFRTLRRSCGFRRKAAGTFQVSVLPGVDIAATPIFGNTAVLMMGSVRERVVAVGGHPVVRPTAYLTCMTDHRVCDGKTVEAYLTTLRDLLERLTTEQSLHGTADCNGAASKPASL